MNDLVERANEFFRQGQYEDTITLCLQVLQQEPENLNALTSISAAYVKLERFGEALMYFDNAIQLQPNNPVLHSERGVAYFLNAQIEEALADLDIAQQLDPKNAYRYSSRAFVKDKAGDPEGAVADYKKAVELDPEDAVSFNNLGLIQEKLGRREQASKSFTKADALDGNIVQQLDHSQVKETYAPTKRKIRPRVNMRQYGSVARSVLTTRSGFRDFISFLFRRRAR